MDELFIECLERNFCMFCAARLTQFATEGLKVRAFFCVHDLVFLIGMQR